MTCVLYSHSLYLLLYPFNNANTVSYITTNILLVWKFWSIFNHYIQVNFSSLLPSVTITNMVFFHYLTISSFFPQPNPNAGKEQGGEGPRLWGFSTVDMLTPKSISLQCLLNFISSFSPQGQTLMPARTEEGMTEITRISHSLSTCLSPRFTILTWRVQEATGTITMDTEENQTQSEYTVLWYFNLDSLSYTDEFT